MENPIVITRVQQVEIPVSDDFSIKNFCNVLNEGDLFDDDRLDWDKENVIVEDYSFAVHNSKLTTNGRTYEFNSPYSIGTLYTDIKPNLFTK